MTRRSDLLGPLSSLLKGWTFIKKTFAGSVRVTDEVNPGEVCALINPVCYNNTNTYLCDF